jgi:hypothetical protein
MSFKKGIDRRGKSGWRGQPSFYKIGTPPVSLTSKRRTMRRRAPIRCRAYPPAHPAKPLPSGYPRKGICGQARSHPGGAQAQRQSAHCTGRFVRLRQSGALQSLGALRGGPAVINRNGELVGLIFDSRGLEQAVRSGGSWPDKLKEKQARPRLEIFRRGCSPNGENSCSPPDILGTGADVPPQHHDRIADTGIRTRNKLRRLRSTGCFSPHGQYALLRLWASRSDTSYSYNGFSLWSIARKCAGLVLIQGGPQGGTRWLSMISRARRPVEESDTQTTHKMPAGCMSRTPYP